MIKKQTVEFVRAALESNGAQMSSGTTDLIIETFRDENDDLLKKATLAAVKESKFRISLAAIAEHLALLKPSANDDHPSPEEAWALVPKSEAETTYLSDEMLDAIYRGDVNTYLERDDFIGAERTFKKLYAENVAKSRAMGRKPTWRASVGHDPSLRLDGLEKAVSRGIISSEKATDFDPQNKAIYLSAEKNYILKLPAERRNLLAERVGQLDHAILQLVEAQDKADTVGWKPEREPTQARLNDPYWIQQAEKLGLTVYEYLVFPAPPHVAQKVHEQLSAQYGFDLRKGAARAATR